MKVVTILNSKHADLAPGMTGLLVGRKDDGFAVRFRGLRRRKEDTICYVAAHEFTAADNAADSAFLISASMPLL